MQKKHLTLIIVLLTLGFGAYIYFNPPKATNTATNSNPEPIGGTTKKTSICMDYSTYDPSQLTVAVVREMVKNYQNKQLVSIKGSSANPMPNDAHSIWFDIDTLKKFIYHIEQGVKQNATTQNNKLGIRIYYAAYPENSKWGKPGYEALAPFLNSPITMQYEKEHTLVMIPTIQLSNGIAADFNPKDKNTYLGFASLPGFAKGDSIYNNMKVFARTVTPTNTNDDPYARNHGQLIPPETAIGAEGF